MFFRETFASVLCSPKFDGDPKTSGLLKGGPRYRPERVSPSPTVASRPTASGGVRDTVLSEPVAAPWPEATMQGRRFVRRLAHRVRPQHGTRTRAGLCLSWCGTRHAKIGTACTMRSTGTQPHKVCLYEHHSYIIVLVTIFRVSKKHYPSVRLSSLHVGFSPEKNATVCSML